MGAKKDRKKFDAATAALIRDLVDPGECWYDRHGGCQEHGYISLERGQLCPHEEAKQWLKTYDKENA